MRLQRRGRRRPQLERGQRVAQRAADQELHRQVVDAARPGRALGRLGAHPALRQALARDLGQGHASARPAWRRRARRRPGRAGWHRRRRRVPTSAEDERGRWGRCRAAVRSGCAPIGSRNNVAGRHDVTPNELAQSLDLPKRAIALVLAGGRGSRLKSLTDRRAKPAVYFGGKFRIIDFALSNCLNSGHAPHRRHHPVQVAQPAAPPAARLGVPEERDERVRRPAAGAAAHRRRELVPRHGRCGLPEPRHPGRATAPTTSSCWPATTSTR